MNPTRRIALIVGVLFFLTFVTSIAAAFAYGPVLTDPNYVIGGGADTRVFIGAFLELLLIITNMGCADRAVPAPQEAERNHRPRLRRRPAH